MQKYEAIAAYYRQEITAGRLARYERLPPFRDLAQHWKVARNTVAAAMAQLEKEGLVTSDGRKGTYVAGAKLAEVVVPFSPGVRVMGTDVGQLDEQSAQRLGVEAGSAYVVVRLALEALQAAPDAGDGVPQELPDPRDPA